MFIVIWKWIFLIFPQEHFLLGFAAVDYFTFAALAVAVGAPAFAWTDSRPWDSLLLYSANLSASCAPSSDYTALSQTTVKRNHLVCTEVEYFKTPVTHTLKKKKKDNYCISDCVGWIGYNRQWELCPTATRKVDWLWATAVSKFQLQCRSSSHTRNRKSK